MAFPYEEYIRADHFPHIWCPGCGHGIITKAMIRAISKAHPDKDNVAVVSGIGCSSRVPGYVDFNTLHTTHGRALAFATGVKLANPKLDVVVTSGDGDCTAIGGNHFIHACRRNIDMALIIFNNYTYGMTGGQYSPTTPDNSWATTAPYGNIEPQFDISRLAIASGATYVARTTSFHVTQMEKLIYDGMIHNGFAVIEVMTGCHVCYGRKNNLKSGVEILKYLKDHAINKLDAKDKPESELENKFITGLLHQSKRPSYLERYEELITRAKKMIGEGYEI